MHNFKRAARIVLPVLMAALLLIFLDLALYPCTFIRNDVHAITTSSYEDVILGTSHGKINIDPAAMERISHRSAYNMANGNEYPVDSYYLLKLMIEKGTAPQRVIYVTTPEYFMMEKEEGHNYLLFFHEFPPGRTWMEYFFSTVASCSMRTGLFPWTEYPLSTELKSVKTNLRKKLSGDYGTEDFQSATQSYHEDGHIARYPVDPSTFSFPDYDAFDPEAVREENLAWIRALVALCREHRISFVAVTPPTAQPVLDRYQEGFEKADSFFSAFYEQLKVHYYNFNASPYDGRFTHSVNAFTDLDGHMHEDAAADFSEVLATTLEEKG